MGHVVRVYAVLDDNEQHLTGVVLQPDTDSLQFDGKADSAYLALYVTEIDIADTACVQIAFP